MSTISNESLCKWKEEYCSGNFHWPWTGLNARETQKNDLSLEAGVVFAMAARPRRLLIILEAKGWQLLTIPCSLCDIPITDDELKLPTTGLVAQVWDARICYLGELPEQLIEYGKLDNEEEIDALWSCTSHLFNSEILSASAKKLAGVPRNSFDDDLEELVSEYRSALSRQFPSNIFMPARKIFQSLIIKDIFFGEKKQVQKSPVALQWPKEWSRVFTAGWAAASRDDNNYQKIPSTMLFTMAEDEHIQIMVSPRRIKEGVIVFDVIAKNAPKEYSVTIYVGNEDNTHEVQLIRGVGMLELKKNEQCDCIGVIGATKGEVLAE